MFPIEHFLYNADQYNLLSYTGQYFHGATGFIGRKVLDCLKKKNVKITILSRSHDPQKTANISYVHADLKDFSTTDSALKNQHIDYIFHLASLPGDTGNPIEMVQTNVIGTQNILEIARTHKIKRMVLVSSTSAYGWYPATPFQIPEYLPVDEKHPCYTKDIYSSTKRIQKILALTYFYEYRVPVTCLRLSAVVGPDGCGGGRSWYTFAEQLAKSDIVQIPHFTFDEQCHYVDIRDVVRMIIHASISSNAEGEIFNCCGEKPTTGYEFKEIIQKHFPWIKVECGFPWSMAQGKVIEFSMKKAQDYMDFTPLYTLEDSIIYIKKWINSGGLQKHIPEQDRYTAGIQQ